MFMIPLGIRGRPGGSPFSLGEEQTFSECAIYPWKKESHPGGDRERPASDLRATCQDKFCGEER